MRSRLVCGFLLLLILGIGAVAFTLGIHWGLPSREADAFLFGGGEPWSGERLAELKPEDEWRGAGVGADVDRNPIESFNDWVDLTATDADRAELLIRYRLYSFQPDEVITLRSLASMKPGAWDFDPRMYHYGGLFIYPIGALLKACDALGWIEIKNLAGYLDDPEAFAKCYLVARGYVVFFGLLGVIACYQLARGIGGRAAGLIIAALYVCMPVVINMAHEAKPHLPAAVLMMYAVLAAFAYVKQPTNWRYCLVALACGAAVAMVWSALPIVVLVGLVLLLDRRSFWDQWWRLLWGIGVTALIFVITNPYAVWHAVRGDPVFWSTFKNSTAMYEFGKYQAGAANVIRLMVAAMGPLAAVCGLFLAFTTPTGSNNRRCALLWVPAVLLLLVHAAVGAGKPGEYGRYLVFPAVALAVPVGVFLRREFRRRRPGTEEATVFAIAMTLLFGVYYESAFLHDVTGNGTRRAAAIYLQDELARNPDAVIGVRREPAPFSMPPVDVANRRVLYWPRERDLDDVRPVPDFIVTADDFAPPVGHRDGAYEVVRVFPDERSVPRAFQTVISWANKPIAIYERVPAAAPTKIAPTSP